jgi:hypothetical protein
LDGLQVASWGLCAALCGLPLAGHAVNQGQTGDFLCDFNAIYIWDFSVAFDGMYIMGFIWDLYGICPTTIVSSWDLDRKLSLWSHDLWLESLRTEWWFNGKSRGVSLCLMGYFSSYHRVNQHSYGTC